MKDSNSKIVASLNSCFKWVFGRRVRYILLIPLALLVVPLALVAALVALAICLGLAMEPEKRRLSTAGCQVSLRGVSHRPV